MALTQSILLTFIIDTPTLDPTLPWLPQFGPIAYFDLGTVLVDFFLYSYDAGTATWVIGIQVTEQTLTVDGGGNLSISSTPYSKLMNLTGIATIVGGVHTVGMSVVSGAVHVTVDGWDVDFSGAPRHGAYTLTTITGAPLVIGKYSPIGQQDPYPAGSFSGVAAGDIMPPSTQGVFFPGAPALWGPDNYIRNYFMGNSSDPSTAMANLTVLFAQVDGAGFWTNRFLSAEF